MNERDAELEAFRQEARQPARSAELAASARAVADWDRQHGVGLDAVLDWIDQLRALFGEPRVDRRVWRGSDFRL